MARSHPPTLITLVRRTLVEECAVVPRDRLLLGVSGGGDSMALLHVLAHLRDRLRMEVVAHGVDHGLRQDAAGELELASALAQRCGVEFGCSRVRVKPGGNLQARAREARFRVLGQVASRIGATAIATAHHADDRAETVLLRLLRGAGPTGLGVLPPRDGNLVRPMIRARRVEVLAHLERHGVRFAHDPSNEDRRFARVRVRLDVMPTLEALSPRLVEHLCSLADRLRDASPPLVLVADGELVALGRAQQEQVRRLLGRRAPGARVLLPGGRELRLEDGVEAWELSGPGCRGGLPKR